MQRKRRSPKRRPPVTVTGNLTLPSMLLAWEWDLLESVLLDALNNRGNHDAHPVPMEPDHETP
jgi:hypothetical protein